MNDDDGDADDGDDVDDVFCCLYDRVFLLLSYTGAGRSPHLSPGYTNQQDGLLDATPQGCRLTATPSCGRPGVASRALAKCYGLPQNTACRAPR